MDPLQLSEYLVEKNCLISTDMVCNIDYKTVRYGTCILGGSFWIKRVLRWNNTPGNNHSNLQEIF